MKFLIKILKNTAKSFTFVFGGAFAVVVVIFIAAVVIYINMCFIIKMPKL